jgi:hypothetical protein
MMRAAGRACRAHAAASLTMHSQAVSIRRLCFVCAIVVLACAGCGQKGDLYLPDEAQTLAPGAPH